MQRGRVVLGLLVAVGLIAGVAGVSHAIDALQGPEITDTTVKRINDTHAAIAWETDEPTYGYLETHHTTGCAQWGEKVNTINDSAFSREHLVIAPIYGLNRSAANRPDGVTNRSLEQYTVQIRAGELSGSDPDYETIVTQPKACR